MEFILLLLVSYYLANNLVTNTAYAVRGLDPPKHKERMARLEHGGQVTAGGYRSGRHGASRFFAEAWHDAWDDAHTKRQELRARREARRAESTPNTGPAELPVQPDGDVDAPGALRPQERDAGDGNVIPLDRTRRSAAPSDGPATVARPVATGQAGDGVTAEPTVPTDAPDGIDDVRNATTEPIRSVVHDGPCPFTLPWFAELDASYPDLHATPEERAAHEASLDATTRQRLSTIAARLEEAEGAPVPVTFTDLPALLQARGYAPEVAQKGADEIHEEARRTGGTLVARKTPTPDRGRTAPPNESQEGYPMSVMTSNNATGEPTGEVVGLGSAIRFAAGMANSMRNAAARTETSVASLTGSEVGPGPTAALQQAMEAVQNAAAAFDHAQAELEKQLSVKEAYDATPDAGNKQFLQND